MSEVTDLVMPVLRKIQDEQGSMKRSIASLEAKVNDVAERTLKIDDRMDTIESHFVHVLGLTTKQNIDVEELQTWRKDAERRIRSMEMVEKS